MGDLVLTEEEVNPVMAKLAARRHRDHSAAQSSAAQSAVHDVHARAGHGDPVTLATELHTALAESKTPFAAPPAGNDPAAESISTQRRLTGRWAPRARMSAVSTSLASRAPRRSRTADMIVPPAMGSANAINFQPTGGGKAAITGDFVLIANEVNPMLKALREHGIEVTAIHNHMLDDQPHLYFMHFWANDDAVKLARA